jgi:aminobenzoyl-glutamate utilization protein B
MEVRFDKACSNYIPNHELGKIMHENLEKFGLPVYKEEEMKFATEIHQQITKEDIQNTKNEITKTSGEEFSEDIKTPYLEKIVPFQKSNEVLFGSSDVGDVSWVVPTSQFWGSSFVFGTPLHSWQLVAQGATPIAHKGMLQAGKTLAGTVLELFQNPELLDLAKKEFEEKRKGTPYECPIPPGVTPSAIKQ